MKHVLIVAIILLNSLLAFSQNSEVSTYYFIRHAEKDRSDSSNHNPHLIEKGKLRAEHWNDVLKNVSFDLIYSTEYHRTIETATPTALNNHLKITSYNPKNIDTQEFLTQTKGKIVFVVGHSHSTPEFVNKLIGTEKYEHIDDNNNANLYIVTISGDTISDTLLLIE